MNSVALTGRLTKDPVIKCGGQDNQTAIARFTLAVEDYNGTDFISCRALGKVAEWAERWTRKGTKVELTGKIKTGHYTNQQDNREVYYTEVLANSMSFGESKREAEQREAAAGQQSNGSQQSTARQQAAPDYDGFMNIPDGIDDELPFN